jgi:hypothetical protein
MDSNHIPVFGGVDVLGELFFDISRTRRAGYLALIIDLGTGSR